MRVQPGIPPRIGSQEPFTGGVHIDATVPSGLSSSLRVNAVHLSPGARSAWHPHAAGQHLRVVEGVGPIHERDQAISALTPGATVHTQPAVWHWPRATPDHVMPHFAVRQAPRSGGESAWGDQVSDEKYDGQPGPPSQTVQPPLEPVEPANTLFAISEHGERYPAKSDPTAKRRAQNSCRARTKAGRCDVLTAATRSPYRPAAELEGASDGLRRVGTVKSPQTLSEADRRLVAAWAADCAERVLGLFEAEAPDDARPRALIARTRAFAQGELNTAEEIRRRFVGGVGVGDVKVPAAAAASRAAGQAVGVCHMGAHALGAAAYATRAVGLADPDRPEAVEAEIRWQLDQMSTDVRAALRALPPVGENRSGPLGPGGLLASGQLGTIIRHLQAGLTQADPE